MFAEQHGIAELEGGRAVEQHDVVVGKSADQLAELGAALGAEQFGGIGRGGAGREQMQAFAGPLQEAEQSGLGGRLLGGEEGGDTGEVVDAQLQVMAGPAALVRWGIRPRRGRASSSSSSRGLWNT
jgi:hypothetical protein